MSLQLYLWFLGKANSERHSLGNNCGIKCKGREGKGREGKEREEKEREKFGSKRRS
jgi:hypothetical protein